MATIKNPNVIVEAYVADYQKALGANLIAVIMYGSAVTHEYVPGVSDINTAIVLKSYRMDEIIKCRPVARGWAKKRVAIPFYFTPESIRNSLDSYPVEFIDMRSNYKVLFGDDVLAAIDINKEHVRIQCERELKGIALHLRKEYIRSDTSEKALAMLLGASLKSLIPLFKAMLIINDRSIPKTKSDIVIAVEELYNLGVSVFSDLLINAKQKTKKSAQEMLVPFADALELLITYVD